VRDYEEYSGLESFPTFPGVRKLRRVWRRIMFQTRSEFSGIKEFPSMREALAEANRDTSVWKISFPLSDERIRLVRKGTSWVYQPIIQDEDQ
jgi:hypothetical protein